MLAGILVPALALCGCEVTPEKIAHWKETEKGPGKLRDVLRGGARAELCSQALVALVEIGMIAEAQEDLKDVPETRRREMIHGSVAPLIAFARGSVGKPPPPDGTTRVQRGGKDALYAFRDWAAPEDRTKMDEALVEWTTVDLSGRMTAGSYSSERILTAVGAAAGPRLAAVIADPSQPEPNRVEAARILGLVGDRGAREQAGVRLVEQARREKRPQEATLLQLGLVGGDHAVAWLIELAGDGKQPAGLRAKALFALAQAPDPAALPTALRLTSDRKAEPEVRDAAFELAEKIGPAAVPGLRPLLDDKDEKVRWRAVEALLTAGRVQAIQPVLEGLPTTRAYPRDDLHDFLVRQIALLGAPALPTLRDALRSKSWVARIAAAQALAEIGKGEDVARLEGLTSDGTRLKGWPGNPTLGTEAKALATQLRARQ